MAIIIKINDYNGTSLSERRALDNTVPKDLSVNFEVYFVIRVSSTTHRKMINYQFSCDSNVVKTINMGW